MESNDKVIVKTLLYHDIFDYPLTEDEVLKFLISEKSVDTERIKKRIRKINSIVYRTDGFLFMEGKKSEVVKRKIRQTESQRKLELAKKIVWKLSFIPTVSFIGISGSLALMNASKNDDIDLFIIARSNTAWITRFFLIASLKFMGKHRGKNTKDVSDKFCLNMIIDEKNLVLPESLRNLYTAHEIVQIRPLIQRDKIYKKFINSNSWIYDFMPNATEKIESHELKEVKNSVWQNIIKNFLSLNVFENSARSLQKVSIKKNLTREIIDDGFIALHPKDYKKIVLSKYSAKLARYGLTI